MSGCRCRRTCATSSTASPTAHFKRELKLQAANLSDYFLLLCYMEVVGLPEIPRRYCPAGDLYPHLLDQFFHLWHRRKWASNRSHRSAACRAADRDAGTARPAGVVLRRQGRRRQDHVRGGDGAGGEPGRASGCCWCPRIRLTPRPTSSSGRSDLSRYQLPGAPCGDLRSTLPPSRRAALARSKTASRTLFGH